MPTQLQELTIKELSVVDSPANPFAKITIAKRSDTADDIVKGARDFKQVVAAIFKRDKCPRTEAMRKARAERPDLLEKYVAASNRVEKEIAIDKARADATQKFRLLAEGIRHKEGCSHREAMSRARTRHPAAYQEMQS
jgi:hypothetical protein